MMQDVIIVCFNIVVHWAEESHWATLAADAPKKATEAETMIVTD